jgi:hypothetical protein
VITALTALFLISVHNFDLFEKARASAPAVAFGGWLAGIGWTTSNAFAQAHFQKTHTMDIVIQMRTSDEIYRHRLNIFANLPYERSLSLAEYTEWKNDRNKLSEYDPTKLLAPPIDSVYTLLNHYEYIAYGVRSGELNFKIIKNCLRSNIVSFVNDYWVVVELEHKKNRKSFEHLIWLTRRLRKRKERPPRSVM